MSNEKTNETKTMVSTLNDAKDKVINVLNAHWAEIVYLIVQTGMALASIIFSAIIFFCVGAFVPGIREALPNFFAIVDRVLEIFNSLTGIGRKLFMC